MAERPTSQSESTDKNFFPTHRDDEQDAAIQAALHSVQLPSGLLGRLQTAVGAQLESQIDAASQRASELRSAGSPASLQPDSTSSEAESLHASVPPGSLGRPSRIQKGNGIQGDAIQGNAIQGNAIQANAIQGDAIQGNGIQSDGIESGDWMLEDDGVVNRNRIQPVKIRTSDAQPEGGLVRRALLVLVLAASVSGFAWLARQWTLPAERSWLMAQSNAILEKVEQDHPANWRETEVTAQLPTGVQAQLARVAVVGQRSLSDFGAKNRGVIYRLDSGDGVGLFLLRVQALPTIRGLTSRFEILPTPSGGWSLAALRVGDETFVLAAACTKEQLFNYVKRPDVT